MMEILTVGEILVEVMREKTDVGLGEIENFKGPFISGAPAIFIDTVANLGHNAAIVGGVGDDDFGNACLKRLKIDGVDVSGINICTLPTGVAFVAYFKDGSRKFIYHIRESAATNFGSLESNSLSEVKIFHIMGCSLMIRKDLADTIIEYARNIKKMGGKISFDPNIRVELMDKNYIKELINTVVELSDIILPGLNELFFIAGVDDKQKAIEKTLKRVELIVLKTGREGCEIYSNKENKPIYSKSYEIEEVDPTGAGDAFDAGFLCALLEGKNIEECGRLANACGALNATRLGPMEGVFSRDIVEEFITKNAVK
jgi:tagatose kinase